ncbi:hypothetical protein [Limosilactobacillus mucosae]|uniref:Uncharacterized protein n=1 Tax=Limosilactobacillus mucosae TaxID=97478 RepID=A0AAJ1HTY1_LIMMU|nr:hypothetical protein [Limosilactobacillus mucosae]MDC2828495.1 hypothetical protein [Limosilactobacillus mucosae]MDC2834507.1 hypothetical protein [Limosilactobacillus mucosae]
MPIEKLIIEPIITGSAKKSLLFNLAIANENNTRLLVLNDRYLAEVYDDEWFKKANPILMNEYSSNILLTHENITNPEQLLRLVKAHFAIDYVKSAIPFSSSKAHFLLMGTLQLIALFSDSDKEGNSDLVRTLSQLKRMSQKQLAAILKNVSIPEESKEAKYLVQNVVTASSSGQKLSLSILEQLIDVLYKVHVESSKQSGMISKSADLDNNSSNFFVIPASVLLEKSLYFQTVFEFFKLTPVCMYLDTSITASSYISEYEPVTANMTVAVSPDINSEKMSSWGYQTKEMCASLQNSQSISVFVQWLAARHSELISNQNKLEYKFNKVVSCMNYNLRNGSYLTVDTDQESPTLSLLQHRDNEDTFSSYNFDLDKFYDELESSSTSDVSNSQPQEDILESLKGLIEQLSEMKQELYKAVDNTHRLETKISQLPEELNDYSHTDVDIFGEFSDDQFDKLDIDQSFSRILEQQRKKKKD